MQVLEVLLGIALEVMGKSVESNAPLMAAGLDSLASVELKNAVSSKLGVSLPVTLAFDYPTLDALSEFVASSLGPAQKRPKGRILFARISEM